jgi:multiple sugar transport system substrate-binding protein
MPTDLVFSIMSDNGAIIQPILDAFEAETGIRVILEVMDWDLAWNELVRAAIYNKGPDISEIGSTWMRDLVGMNVLRPFTVGEIASMGRSQSYVPAAWANVALSGERAWAVPWMAGSRLIYYRPRLFAQAGVDPANAFASPERLLETAWALYENGVRVPLTIATGGTHATLHNISSWIWAEGGDFLSPDGESLAILSPEALRGMRAYFLLGRFLPPGVPLIGAETPEEYFRRHTDTAMTISGTWLFSGLGDQVYGPESEYALAPMPGPSFVGGSNLAIWKFSNNVDTAVQLARYLTRVSVQARLSAQLGLLPARIDALEMDPYSTVESWKMAAAELRSGRSFPAVGMWGVIEDRLTMGMDEVWKAIFAQPGSDPQEALVRCLTPHCHRLDILLSNT